MVRDPLRATRNFGEMPESTRPPAAHVRRSPLATPQGRNTGRQLLDCNTCPDRELCSRSVIRLGMFARLECEMASGEIKHTDGRRVNISQEALRILQEADAPMTTVQLARQLGTRSKSLWRTLRRLEEDGHIVGTVRYKEALNAREAVWQIAEV